MKVAGVIYIVVCRRLYTYRQVIHRQSAVNCDDGSQSKVKTKLCRGKNYIYIHIICNVLFFITIYNYIPTGNKGWFYYYYYYYYFFLRTRTHCSAHTDHLNKIVLPQQQSRLPDPRVGNNNNNNIIIRRGSTIQYYFV